MPGQVSIVLRTFLLYCEPGKNCKHKSQGLISALQIVFFLNSYLSKIVRFIGDPSVTFTKLTPVKQLEVTGSSLHTGSVGELGWRASTRTATVKSPVASRLSRSWTESTGARKRPCASQVDAATPGSCLKNSYKEK